MSSQRMNGVRHSVVTINSIVIACNRTIPYRVAELGGDTAGSNPEELMK